MIVTRSPCQECKAERDRLAEQLALSTRERDEARKGWQELAALAESDATSRERLRDALLEAIARLNDFLSAYEGAPEPSENDTKALVARLHDALQTTPETT